MNTNYLKYERHALRLTQCARTALGLLTAGVVFGLLYTFFPDSTGLRALCITALISHICFSALAAYHHVKARRALKQS